MAHSRFGHSVISIGDVNDDGYEGTVKYMSHFLVIYTSLYMFRIQITTNLLGKGGLSKLLFSYMTAT